MPLDKKVQIVPHPSWQGMTSAQLRAALVDWVLTAPRAALYAVTYAVEAAPMEAPSGGAGRGSAALGVPEVREGAESLDRRLIEAGDVVRQSGQEFGTVVPWPRKKDD